MRGPPGCSRGSACPAHRGLAAAPPAGRAHPAGAAQLAFLALFAAARFLPAIVGTRVSLAVRRGPRDFFSFGDFITLRYDIESGVRERARACEGGNVYAILAPPAAAGGSWTLEDAVSSPPSLFSGKVFVAGTCTYGGFSFGANAYFVEEGAGRRWEQQSLLADVAVSPWGQALLLSLRCPALVRPETVASLQEHAEYALVDFFDLCKVQRTWSGSPPFFWGCFFQAPRRRPGARCQALLAPATAAPGRAGEAFGRIFGRAVVPSSVSKRI